MGRIFLLVLYATSYSSGTPLETRRSAASGPNDPASSPSRADLGSVRQRPPVWPVRSEPRAGAGRLSDSQDPGEAGSPGACIYCLPRNHTQHSFNLSSCPSAPERPDGLKLPHRALLLSTYLITFIYLSSVNSSANSGAPGGPSSGVYLAALSPGAGCGVRPQRLLSCWGRWMEAVSPFPVHRESLPNACSMRDAGKCCEILLSIFYFRFYSQP